MKFKPDGPAFERLKREFGSSPDGVASLHEVLERLEFPVTRSELIKHAGSHLVELREGVMVFFEDAVNRSKKDVFNTPDEIVEAVRAELILKRGFLEEAG